MDKYLRLTQHCAQSVDWCMQQARASCSILFVSEKAGLIPKLSRLETGSHNY